MPAFVHIADAIFSADRCKAMIDKFRRDPARRAGRVGDGVETALKRSTDLPISTLPHWRDECDHVRELAWVQFMGYARRFPHVVVGGLLPRVRPAGDGDELTVDARTFASASEASQQRIARSAFAVGGIALQHYEAGSGGYPHWHSEIYPRAGDTDALHRVLFLLVYLNDVEAGGHTDFAYQKLRVRPKAGRIVLAPAGFTHTHRGRVPTSGDKFILASWIVFRAATEGRAPREPT